MGFLWNTPHLCPLSINISIMEEGKEQVALTAMGYTVILLTRNFLTRFLSLHFGKFLAVAGLHCLVQADKVFRYFKFNRLKIDSVIFLNIQSVLEIVFFFCCQV